MTQRDTVVIGSSAGGVEALPRLIGQLPQGFPASILIGQHMAENPDPMLVHIIQRVSQLPVQWADQGERLTPGRVYVTPPGLHMMVVDGHLGLLATPRENYVRPSIDRLFKSAAEVHRERTIGILLTGLLGDGVDGLRAIQQAGGYTIVQDPADAEFSELPRRALAAFEPDCIASIDAIGAVLIRLTR